MNDQIDADQDREAAKSAPYEYRVLKLLGGANRKHRCTPVLEPSGRVRLLPVHRFNAGQVCGGDVPLRAEPVRMGQDGMPIEWSVSIRPHFAQAGWELYRDFLKRQPDGDKYERILDAVLDAMEFDIDGRPTWNPKMSAAQREGWVHPEATARRGKYHEGKRVADMSEVDKLLAEVGIDPAPAEMSREEIAAAKVAAAKQAKQKGLL